MKVKLVVQYLGLPYHGWQRQVGLKTVQGELESAISLYWTSQGKKLGLGPFDSPTLSGSGRTDAGVHALEQVASFSWPETLPFDAGRFRNAINGITDSTLTVLHAEAAPDRFDARMSPHVKQYRYRLLLRSGSDGYFQDRAWTVRSELDVKAMILAAAHFVGTHDFSSFRGPHCVARTTMRSIQVSEFSRVSEYELDYIVQAKGFLKQMVRIMVGTLVSVGAGKISPDEIPEIIQSRSRDRTRITAPAKGLVLDWVKYLDKELHK